MQFLTDVPLDLTNCIVNQQQSQGQNLRLSPRWTCWSVALPLPPPACYQCHKMPYYWTVSLHTSFYYSETSSQGGIFGTGKSSLCSTSFLCKYLLLTWSLVVFLNHLIAGWASCVAVLHLGTQTISTATRYWQHETHLELPSEPLKPSQRCVTRYITISGRVTLHKGNDVAVTVWSTGCFLADKGQNYS